MIYVVESFQLTEEARKDPSFEEWLRRFNALVVEKNPTVQSVDVYSSYTGAFEVEVWFGMEDFAALDRSAESEQEMFRDAEVMEEWERFAAYMQPVGRRIMLRVA
jgi:hypothetical protein